MRKVPPSASARTGWWDFKKHVVDGKTYYSYHDQTGAYDDYGLEGYAPGERVILDESFEEIKRIAFEASDVVAKGDPTCPTSFTSTRCAWMRKAISCARLGT